MELERAKNTKTLKMDLDRHVMSIADICGYNAEQTAIQKVQPSLNLTDLNRCGSYLPSETHVFGKTLCAPDVDKNSMLSIMC